MLATVATIATTNKISFPCSHLAAYLVCCTGIFSIATRCNTRVASPVLLQRPLCGHCNTQTNQMTRFIATLQLLRPLRRPSDIQGEIAP